ncbi:uncharacterized protein LOC129306937 [Prosopis cineraria]|uniref:uncharacterized protein LOC129306937 n=1 Tax=Prosopis cineraria TaxID=364024 RepID=UPI00240FCA72|nr:uncharacterized protein LOC129306937 [Prosopis cineraria]
MGCVSSKLLRKDLRQEVFINANGGDYVNHVVSLTSSTYGALKLDSEQPGAECVADSKRLEKSPPREDPEVINAWELMEDLEDGVPVSNQAKKSPKPSPFLRGFIGSDTRSPFKLLNQFGSPKTVKKFGGKENKVQGGVVRGGMRRLDYSPKGILKSSNFSPKPSKPVLNPNFSLKGSPICASRNSFGSDSGHSSRKRSPTPLFDPELLATYEKELSEEEEQIKRMVWATPKGRRSRKSQDTEPVLQAFEKMCPPGGENSVVIYTTTLRGIRKTFEDCNKVRLILESHDIRIFERDISMDAGLKEELRQLMGTKGVKVPTVFVKGRLIGGVDEVVKLEEEEKLGILFEGIPRARVGCEGCGDVRFVMCSKCNGSCKVLDKEHQKTVKCGQCNENGLIQCPICC